MRGKDNKELRWSIALALLISIWMGIAPAWYNWYLKPENGLWMKDVYRLLDGNELVNIPICLILAFVAFRWGRRIWGDCDIRWYRPVLAIIGLVVLYYGSNVEYAKAVSCVSYRMVLTLLLAGMILVMLVKGICRLWNNKQKEGDGKPEDVEKPLGFTGDKTDDRSIPESLKKYAGVIVERLLVTDIKEQSYALGVTGEWGVGKTTFLSELKKNIGNRADIVEFNPWMCGSPEQVTSDFFASLQHQLSGKYSTLSKSIRDYAKYVNNVTVAPHPLLSVEGMVPVKQESLFERKKTLSERFARLPKPVVVVIDDVDRLERDEVFEVLRLIRNTADLSNVIYMVAYDKEYVTSVLKEKEIKDAAAYLEKIFPVEVHLPKVEEHLVWETLYKEIKAQSSVGDAFADSLFKHLTPDEKELVLKVLDNYRRAKRFARLYMLNMAYLNQQTKNELKLKDVFWLELLQMYDKKTYDVLADEPGVLLFYDGEKYRIKEGIVRTTVHDDKNKYEGEKFWREETPKILEKMFGRYVKTIRQSICFAENYDKFFTLSVSPYRLSVKEMNELFEPGAKAEVLVEKWVTGGKYFSSIAYQFRQVGVNKLNEEQLKAYLCGLLHFNMKVAPFRSTHTWEVKKMLADERYAKGIDLKAHDIVMEWFDEMMKEDRLLPALSKMLHRLYITETVEADGSVQRLEPLLISNSEVESLLVKVMNTYLANHEEVTALDVLSENGALACIFGNCCVTVKDAMATENYCHYKQVAFDAVMAHFAGKKQKPTREAYERAFEAMFSVETPVFDDPVDEDAYWDYAGEAYDNKMQEYFGSKYDAKKDNPLAEFKERCFVEGEAYELKVAETE
jgi:hypothetical protein